MHIPVHISEREYANRHYIYLYCIDSDWWAFGYSAHYLSLLYPELKAVRVPCSDRDRQMACMKVPGSQLIKLSLYDTRVSDECVQVEVPPSVRVHRHDYGKWCETLTEKTIF